MQEIVWSAAIEAAIGRALVYGLALCLLWIARYLALSMMTGSTRPWRTITGAVAGVLVAGVVVFGQRPVSDVMEPIDPLRGGDQVVSVATVAAQDAATRAILVMLMLGYAVGDGLVKGWRARPISNVQQAIAVRQ